MIILNNTIDFYDTNASVLPNNIVNILTDSFGNSNNYSINFNFISSGIQNINGELRNVVFGSYYSALGLYSEGLVVDAPVVSGTKISNAILLQCPAYRNSLISASLNINILTSDSYTPSPVNSLIKTDRSFLTTYNNQLYDNANFNINTTTGVIGPGSTTINITNILSGVIYSDTWNKNDYLVVFLEPEPNTINNGFVGINLDTSSLVISYAAIAPFAPTNVVLEAGYKQLFVSWNEPSDDGGSPIVSYQVEYAIYDTINGIDSWNVAGETSSTSFTLINLDNNIEYVARVAAINAVGMGDYSNNSSELSPSIAAAPRTSNTFNDSNYTRIRLRRDTSLNWSGINPTLGLGEAGFETDNKFLKVGDNITSWNNLDYVRVPSNTIDFPDPPEVSLIIGDSKINEDNPRILCNLSRNEKLNIVGENGINLAYSPDYNALIFSLNQIFTPFSTGTLYSPNSRGRPGSVYYDNDYIYMCVSANSWKRIPLESQYWFAADALAISNSSGNYPSVTDIYFSGNNIIITSDGDPYPAKASTNLANDGITLRSDFFNSYQITEQSYNFIFRYRGGTNSSSPEIALSGYNGLLTNGCLVSNPSAGQEAVGIFAPPANFHFNRTFFGSFFKLDDCGGYVNFNREYSYYNGKFLKTCWNDFKVYNSNSYYSGTQYNGDYFRHADGHSKILGFCFDGYPIYGPFGYTDSETSLSGISLMTSSYIAHTGDDHRPDGYKYTNALVVNDINYNLTAGAFIEDFYYVENSGTLDQYNGRYAITPEYPNGTYAYYLTFTNSGLLIPAYPYIIGNYSKQNKVEQQLIASLVPLTVDGYFPLFTNSNAASNYGLLRGGDGTFTTYTIFGDTYFMPNGVAFTEPYAPTNIILSSNIISEKATLDSIIGVFSTTDSNLNDTHTYSLVSGPGDDDNNNFIIYNNELRVNSILSHGIQPEHSIRIRTTDQTNRFFEKVFNIYVLAGTTFTSLNISSGIASLIANNQHTFGSTTVGSATDFEYTWSIYGSPYVSGSDYSSSTLSLSSINIPNRSDETIYINLSVKSISAFTTLGASTSFILDHSEDPICVNGYYPLYSSIYDSNRDPNGDGTSHQHTVLGVIYYMPNGLLESYHGNYPCPP